MIFYASTFDEGRQFELLDAINTSLQKRIFLKYKHISKWLKLSRTFKSHILYKDHFGPFSSYTLLKQSMFKETVNNIHYWFSLRMSEKLRKGDIISIIAGNQILDLLLTANTITNNLIGISIQDDTT